MDFSVEECRINFSQLLRSKSFHDAVDGHLEDCKKNKLKASIPFKGSFNVRIG